MLIAIDTVVVTLFAITAAAEPYGVLQQQGIDLPDLRGLVPTATVVVLRAATLIGERYFLSLARGGVVLAERIVSVVGFYYGAGWLYDTAYGRWQEVVLGGTLGYALVGVAAVGLVALVHGVVRLKASATAVRGSDLERSSPVPNAEPASARSTAAVRVTQGEGAGDPPARAIFISYRRSDNLHAAHRLHDYLADRFGEESLFIDLDTIRPGTDFVGSIEEALARCRVVLAVIGPGWLTAVDQDGRRRLDDPHDYVRLEIESALRRDIIVIPVLVDATIPAQRDLPASLHALALRNAVELRDTSFRSDCARLADYISSSVPSARQGA